MKKSLYTLIIYFVVAQLAQAQDNFKLQEVGYIGALGTAVGNDWTTGWTNFDPKSTNYANPTDTTTLNGMLTAGAKAGVKEITSNLTLDSSKVYLLKGVISVRSGVTLTIQPGTLIRAIADINATPKNYACIIIERGAKIAVNGTINKPVIITSSKAAGSRNSGDWGGLVICGKAKNNQLVSLSSTGIQIEGFNNVTADPTLAFHGGSDDSDNSGSISFLRLEFPGLAFEPNKEINGLTLGSVGNATIMNNVQVSFSNDDSFEWFGGTVNSKNLIAWKGVDDDFDTDFGYRGLNQFGLAVKDSSLFDLTYNATSGASTSEGFESDNDANGSGLAPFTNAVFSNYTMIGPIPVGSSYTQLSDVKRAAFRRGARIRRNSSLRIVNSIFMGYRNFVMIDGDSSVRNTNVASLLTVLNTTAISVKDRQLMFNNNLIVNTTAAFTPASTTANGLVEVSTATRLADINAWMRQTGALANKIDPVAFTDGTVLINPNAYSTTPNFRPVANSPAISGANFKDNPVLTNLFLVSAAKDLSKLEKITPIYPNPVSNGTVYFGKEVASYGIFNINGSLVSYGISTDKAEVNTLNKGMYFIKLDGNVQKLVIE
jgi:hypothetical protein